MSNPILSRDDERWFQPIGSPRRYLLAPLTRRERNLFRRALVAEGAVMHSHETMLDALRDALREIAPGNLDELLAMVDAAQDDDDARKDLAPVEAIARSVPAYASRLADNVFYLNIYPGVMARFALRGWEGEGLPPFQRHNGMVLDAALEGISDDELRAVGWEAATMTFVPASAEKNSEAPLRSD